MENIQNFIDEENNLTYDGKIALRNIYNDIFNGSGLITCGNNVINDCGRWIITIKEDIYDDNGKLKIFNDYFYADRNTIRVLTGAGHSGIIGFSVKEQQLVRFFRWITPTKLFDILDIETCIEHLNTYVCQDYDGDYNILFKLNNDHINELNKLRFDDRYINCYNGVRTYYGNSRINVAGFARDGDTVKEIKILKYNDIMDIPSILFYTIFYSLKKLDQKYVLVDKNELTNECEQIKDIGHDILFNYIQNPSEDKLGEYFKEVYPDSFIYDIENKKWYKKNKYGIYYPDTDELISARVLMSDVIHTKCTEIYTKKIKKLEGYLADKLNTQIGSALKRLSTIGSKKIMIEKLKEVYKIKNFRSKTNNNKYIFAFDNGVYDLRTREFRNAERSELVLQTAGYKYTPSSEETKELIIRTIKDMFLEPELYEYFMTIISLRLVKINELEEFYFMIGNASNGKGLITSLIENTFGYFAQTLESSAFSQNKNINAESATPAMASTYNSNIVFVNELSKEMKITADVLKKISGNDKIKTRFLRENCFEFVPGYGLFFVSNYEPGVDGNDMGIQRRLRFIPFDVTFTDNPTKPNQRKINRELKQLFRSVEYQCAFFDILTGYYERYINSGKKIDIPEVVKSKSDKYLEDNDSVMQFFNTCIVITDDNNDRVRASDLYDAYVNYNNGDWKGYTRSKLKQRIQNDFGIKNTRLSSGVVFMGIKIQEEEN